MTRSWRHVAALLLCLFPLAAWSDGWALRKSDGEREIRVYQRDSRERAYDDIYAVTVMPGSVRQVEAVLADIPAMPQWVPRVAQAKVLRSQGDQVWTYMQYVLPYPFRARDAVVMSERSEHKGVVTIRSQAVKGLVRPHPDRVRLSRVQSTWKITPLPDGRVRVELWGIAVPGGLIPAMAYNFNLADDGVQTMRQLRRMALRSKYQDEL